MPGQRIPKVAAALLAAAAMTAAAPVDANDATGETFVEVLTISEWAGEQAVGTEHNVGCAEN